MENLTISYNDTPSYDIIYGNSFEELLQFSSSLNLAGRKVMIISDTKVASLYMDAILCVIKKAASYVSTYIFPEGEQSKNLDIVRNAYTKLIEEHFNRNDLIIAFGGGVVGDLSGFTAATYLRGIDFIQVPTTLLSMVDSSIGGKTGVDFDSYKNMVGAFYMPRLVYMNLSVLHSLDKNQYYSGMGEVVKSALIKDREFYNKLRNTEVSFEKVSDETLLYMVHSSNIIKKNVVENDPTEKGERALLNFGHTLGHAIEKYMNFKLLHGECVFIGTIMASYISMRKGYIDAESFDDIKDFILKMELPHIEALDTETIISYTKNDKKAIGNKVKFILLKSIGDAFISTDVTDDDMRDAINYYMNNINDSL